MSSSRPEHAAAAHPRYPACRLCCLRPLCGPGVVEAPSLERLIRRRRHVPRGGYLFRTGEPFHAVSAICAGSIKLCALTEEGVSQVVGFHLPGELVGMGGMEDRQHRYDAVALEDTEVCEIPFGRLEEAADQWPLLRRSMFRCLSGEIARSEDRLASFVGRKSAAARLAACLLSLSRRLEQRGLPGDYFVLTLSRSDLSSYLGLAKETVSRLFTRFQQDGLIRLETRGVRLCDRSGLMRIAESGE